MGVVYRATDITLDRPVALKLLTPSLARDRVFRARFERECRLAAALDHPHVVQIFHAGTERGALYLTMRFVDGTDLRALLAEEGRLEPARAVAIVAQVAEALTAAHGRGLVHRDVKPANVLISTRAGREHAFLTDFGITMDRVRGTDLTNTGFAVGTADYMSPEQARGSEVDARADVYALGCVLYRALTGNLVYDKDSDVEKMWAHIHEPPPACSTCGPSCRRRWAMPSSARWPSCPPTASSRPASSRTRRSPRSARDAERGLEPVEVGRAEHHAVARRDVDEVEVDAGPGDLAGQVGEHAGAVLDVDHHDLALARDREVRDRQRVLRRLGVGDEDVQLGLRARPDARRRGDVDPGVADRGGDLARAPRACSRGR